MTVEFGVGTQFKTNSVGHIDTITYLVYKFNTKDEWVNTIYCSESKFMGQIMRSSHFTADHIRRNLTHFVSPPSVPFPKDKVLLKYYDASKDEYPLGTIYIYGGKKKTQHVVTDIYRSYDTDGNFLGRSYINEVGSDIPNALLKRAELNGLITRPSNSLQIELAKINLENA